MIDVVKNHLEEIIDACKEMQVKSLYLFGSAARINDFEDDSDLDFLYNMITDERGLLVSKYDYFDLLWKLEEITGRKVDLVSEAGIRNKYFLQSILEDRIKLYEAQHVEILGFDLPITDKKKIIGLRHLIKTSDYSRL
jgi:predicted nucleotidyltransferase